MTDYEGINYDPMNWYINEYSKENPYVSRVVILI